MDLGKKTGADWVTVPLFSLEHLQGQTIYTAWFKIPEAAGQFAFGFGHGFGAGGVVHGDAEVVDGDVGFGG